MRPPLQVCIGCRGRFYGYRNVCAGCLREQASDSAAAAEEARLMREARRQERVDGLEGSAPLGYGELPEGF